MGLSRKFYDVLVDILHDTHDLDEDASLLHSDRAIARRFGVSESTARNWRRDRIGQIWPSVTHAIIDVCEQIAPERVPDLEFIGSLSHGVKEVKLAAESVVDELTEQVFDDTATWHIYSGPLKMAFDLNYDPSSRTRLMDRANLIVRRALDMHVDQANIPCIDELIRYSTHGWWVTGLLTIRELSLSSPLIGIDQKIVGPIEAALYFGDGCAAPNLYLGNIERSRFYSQHAISLLEDVDPSAVDYRAVDIHDALTAIKSIQTTTACHDGYASNEALITRFVRDFGSGAAQNEWVEGLRHEALGYIELVRRDDFAKAAYHFEQAVAFCDKWLSRFGIPFSSMALQSLRGYAMLMIQGPTENVKAQMSEGLLRTIDYGAVCDQIRARVCQSIFYRCRGEEPVAKFHRAKAEELARQYGVVRWYTMLNGILRAPASP